MGGRKQFGPSRLTWEVSASNSYELDSAGNPKADFSWIGAYADLRLRPHDANQRHCYALRQQLRRPSSPLQVASNWGFKDITISTGRSAQMNLTASGFLCHALPHRLSLWRL